MENGEGLLYPHNREQKENCEGKNKEPWGKMVTEKETEETVLSVTMTQCKLATLK